MSAAPAIIAGAWLLAADREKAGDRPPVTEIEWVEVRRADLDTTVVAGGDLQPTKETMVTCQVEDITDADGTMIVSMVDNGTLVKKGDELCRLDSSELEELARQQEILVGQARSACVQAQLRLETARIAMREYRDGLVIQQTKEHEGRIALGRSDTQRIRDHLNWAERMVAKGYASRAQIDHCVVRAPQDGIAIHSMRGFWRRNRLQPGVRVYENQELFKLADLSQMEVEVSVNESMGPRVKVRMRAEIQVASLGERRLPGRVSSITPLSSVNDKE
jgi:multidrug resistance efflux pump